MSSHEIYHSDRSAFLRDIRCSSNGASLRRGAFLTWIRRITLVTSDIIAFSIAWFAAHNWGLPTISFWSAENLWKSLILVIGLSLSIFAARNLYRAGEKRRDYLALFKAISLSAILIALIDYLYRPDSFLSRSQLLIFWLASIVFVISGRFVTDKFTHYLRLKGAICYPVIVIADDDYREQALKLIEKEHRYVVADILNSSSLDFDRRDETFSKLQMLGIVEVFAAWNTMKNRMFLGQHFQSLGITLHVVPFEHDLLLQGAKLQSLNGCIPCVTFTPPTIAGINFWVKRLFDIIAAALILVLASPIYLALAIAILIDSPGPVFYGQTRVGLHGRPFKAWKFRSMVQNADHLQAQLEKMNQTKDGVLFKIKDDPRVTRVGRFIRQYSLDELPQIFNVLTGEMSLVGPRPLPLRDVEKFKQRYFIRQDVLPGITGLWQVSGRSDIDNFDDVLMLDLYYIQNWSVGLDLSILIKTFSAVLQKSGAY